MDSYSVEDIREAHLIVSQVVSLLEKMVPKFEEGTSQHTLLMRRIAAFNIALALFQRELGESKTIRYTEEELLEAHRAIQSTLNKLSKMLPRLQLGSSQHARLMCQIKACDFAKALTARELELFNSD